MFMHKMLLVHSPDMEANGVSTEVVGGKEEGSEDLTRNTNFFPLPATVTNYNHAFQEI